MIGPRPAPRLSFCLCFENRLTTQNVRVQSPAAATAKNEDVVSTTAAKSATTANGKYEPNEHGRSVNEKPQSWKNKASVIYPLKKFE